MVRLVVLGLASLAAVGDGVRVRREFRALSRDQQLRLRVAFANAVWTTLRTMKNLTGEGRAKYGAAHLRHRRVVPPPTPLPVLSFIPPGSRREDPRGAGGGRPCEYCSTARRSEF